MVSYLFSDGHGVVVVFHHALDVREGALDVFDSTVVHRVTQTLHRPVLTTKLIAVSRLPHLSKRHFVNPLTILPKKTLLH